MAQIFSKEAFEANKGWSLGILGSYMHFDNDITRGAVGFNLRIKGIYVQIMGWTGSHDRDVKVDRWSEETSHAFHVGYQLPITKKFSIIPLVGYAAATTTNTDGYNWGVDSGGIHNSVSSSNDANGFDYGASLSLGLKRVELYGICTAHCLGGGIGYHF